MSSITRKTAKSWNRPGFAAGPSPPPRTRQERSPAELRTFLAKFANLGKGQGTPRPVGIGSGMGVGMAGKPTARGCGVPREPTSDSCSLPPCLPVEPVPVQVQSSPIPSSVPGLMIPLPRGPLVFPQPSSMRCQIAQPGRSKAGQAFGTLVQGHQVIETSHRCSEKRPDQTCHTRGVAFVLIFFSSLSTKNPACSLSYGDSGAV